MKTRQKILTILLVGLLGAAAYGLYRTGQPAKAPVAPGKTKFRAALQAPYVDQTPLLTAQRLAKMPTSAEELPFVQEVLRLADQEMDLAFAAAVREAEAHPPALSAEAKGIQERKQQAERALEADEAQVKQLTAVADKARGARKDALEEELEAAKAQVELDQDEVDDAKQDLIRAGGDPQGRIQTMIEEHEAASKAADSFKVAVTAPVEQRGLIPRFQQWFALHQKQLELQRAKRDAESLAASFFGKHNQLEAQIAKARTESSQAGAPAGGGTSSSNTESRTKPSHEESQALLKATKLRSKDQKALASFDKRIDDQKQLAEVYGDWIDALAAKQRAIVHRVLTAVAIILGIGLVGLFFDSWLERLLGRTSLDRRQVETLRTLTRVIVQVFAVLFILLVIFGPPSQLGTFLGLAGAGLTVALKDFIVAFIGWLVLMGKNGIRLGDWVEINGVSGEVVELGMFHTVLLETGNWTDTGHPTGRRVTFTNSFAIEGHYFNFSTSGQWLWDELQVVLPTGLDPYPVIEAIQKKVAEATEATAKQAENEWKSAARSRDMSALTAAPAINLKPVIGGVEIAVRYITRASERYQLRAKLYQAAVDLLGHGAAPRPAAPPPAHSSD